MLNLKENLETFTIEFSQDELKEAAEKILKNSPVFNLRNIGTVEEAALICFVKGEINSPRAQVIRSALVKKFFKKSNPVKSNCFFKTHGLYSAQIEELKEKLGKLQFLNNPRHVSLALGCIKFELENITSQLRRNLKEQI